MSEEWFQIFLQKIILRLGMEFVPVLFRLLEDADWTAWSLSWKHMEVSRVMGAPLSIWFIMEHPIKKWMI